MKSEDRRDILTKLLDILGTDTFCQDFYLERARFYLEQEISEDSYQALKRMKTQLEGLPNQIRNAIMHKEWQKVKELSERSKELKQEIADKADLQEFCEKIFEDHEINIDPFSPGMHTMAGVTMDRLKHLHDHVMTTLKKLSVLDPGWSDFYSQRLKAFQALIIQDNPMEDEARFVPEVVLEEKAEEALESGNMDRLEELAEKILQNHAEDDSPDSAQLLADKHWQQDDYSYTFSPEVISRAEEYGLAHYRVPSDRDFYTPFARFAWHPTFSAVKERQQQVLKIPDIPFDNDTPEALKTRIQLFAIHPFINSAGVRYLPQMVAEDALVEDFPDPDPDNEMPLSKLLTALGLKQRNYIDRKEIEAKLLKHGNDFLHDALGLDHRQFKLVCIPPDLHLRIGKQEGWGNQKIWTHFDGYMLMEGAKRKALAGGDVRYGGIYDLLGINNSYSSERIVVRFAVVQRKRLAIWQ